MWKRRYNGDDSNDAGKAMRDWGSFLGSAIGGRYGGGTGSSIGSYIGKGLGAGLSLITGNGDYVTHNSLMNGGGGGNVSFGNGRIRITHREFIQDISSTTAFSIMQLEINPGLYETFPFLSQLAINFETYEMHGLVFEYRSTSADALNSTNTALGTVIMAVQYNCLNTPFTGKQQMESYEGAVSSAPSQGMICGVECCGDLPLRDLYVRTGIVPTGQDERFYDMGEFNLATVGMQASNTIGELWVAYDITLKYPKLSPSVGIPQGFLHYQNTGSISTNYYFGTAYNQASGTVELNFASSNTVLNWPVANFPYNGTYFQAGIYLLIWTCWAPNNSSNIINPGLSPGSAFTGYSAFAAGNSSYVQIGTEASSKMISITQFFKFTPDQITQANNSITFTGGTFPNSPSYVDLMILPMANDFL